MRIYLDVCCLNRPFDDQSQVRIRLEAEAVILILSHFESGEWQWVSSEAVNQEVFQTPEPERRRRTQLLLEKVQDVIFTTDDRMLRLAQRFAAQLRVTVDNPLTWLSEVTR